MTIHNKMKNTIQFVICCLFLYGSKHNYFQLALENPAGQRLGHHHSALAVAGCGCEVMAAGRGGQGKVQPC